MWFKHKQSKPSRKGFILWLKEQKNLSIMERFSVRNALDTVNDFATMMKVTSTPIDEIQDPNEAKRTIRRLSHVPDFDEWNTKNDRRFKNALQLYSEYLCTFPSSPPERNISHQPDTEMKSAAPVKINDSAIGDNEEINEQTKNPIIGENTSTIIEETPSTPSKAPSSVVEETTLNSSPKVDIQPECSDNDLINEQKKRVDPNIKALCPGNFYSWEIVDEHTAIKTCDKSFFAYNGSGIPMAIGRFFGVETLASGQSRAIVLRYEGESYEGKITNETTDRTRFYIYWSVDLGKLFQSSKNIPDQRLLFKKREGVYEVGFVAGSPKTVPRKSNVDAFMDWMKQKNIPDSVAHNYMNTIYSAEIYAQEIGIIGVSLTSSNCSATFASIGYLLSNKAFIQYDTVQDKRFSEAFSVLSEFISEKLKREEAKSSNKKQNNDQSTLYQKLYTISKVYDDPSGLNVDQILFMLGFVVNKSELIELLEVIPWATKIDDELYSFSKDAKRVREQTLMTNENSEKKATEQQESFDKSAFITVLTRRFPNGMEMDSIDLEIFRDTYKDIFNDEPKHDDETLKKIIRQCGIIYQDRVFPAEGIIDVSTKEKLFNYINQQFSAGKKALFYKLIFSDLAEDFAHCYSLTDEHMLKAYLEFVVEDNQYFFYEDYLSTEQGVKIDHSEEVLNFMLSCGKPVSYDEIYSGLSHIPKDIILREVRSNPKFVRNEKEHYFHIDSFEYSREDGKKLEEIIRNEINENGYAIWSKIYLIIQEQMPAFIDNNYYLSSLGIRNAISQHMSSLFNFENEVISAHGERLSMGDVFRLYAKNHKQFSDADIYEFSQEIGSAIYFGHLAQESVRVSKKLFVAKELVNFDVDAIDRVLGTYLSNSYTLIKDVDSFLLFPYVGFEWNEFLLESFLLNYSKIYTLVNNGTSLNNVAGAIAKKDGAYTRFINVCAQVLADSDIELKKATSLDYLAKVNLITRRSYKELDTAIEMARQLRNKKG